ncbi:MAG: site-specific DNA-methyltransferase [Anaerolineales bacterium]|nr:site-specific DNA-methyltransferase [Anaerolineales bacterium]
MNKVYIGDNLQIMKREIVDNSVDLIYIDPPFNTRKSQSIAPIKVKQSENGDRKGFLGKTYEVIKTSPSKWYTDNYGERDQFEEFIELRLREAHRVLAEHGMLYFHIDYREVHYCRLLLDKIFGQDCYLNEIIWAYDYGGRSKTRWPAKHDNILVYSKSSDPNVTHFDKHLAYKIGEKFEAPNGAGKKPIGLTDVWWHTIVPTNGKERTGYPTQKPLGIINRIIETSSKPGDLVLDFFAGSGTTGESCLKLGRKFILMDNNPQAELVMRERFKPYGEIVEFIHWNLMAEKAGNL